MFWGGSLVKRLLNNPRVFYSLNCFVLSSSFFSETSALSVNTKENKLVHCNVTRVVTPQQSPTSINGSWILCTATLPLATSDWGPLSLDHLLFCEDCKSTAWQSVYGSWAPWSLCRRRWLGQSVWWWVVAIHGPSEDNLNVQTWHRSYYVAPAAHSEQHLWPQQYCNIVTAGQFYNCTPYRVAEGRRRYLRQI